MSRRFFLFFILFLFLPFFSVNAQQASQRWVCLNAIHCWEKKPESAACIIKDGHRALLTVRPDAKLLPNKETYINECLATATGQICTTGKKGLDISIYGVDNTAVLKTSSDYQFEGLFAADGTTLISNPINSRGDRTIDPVYWKSYSSGNGRRFLALNYFEPTTNQGAGEEKTQQIGTFSFEDVVSQSDCISISWDPYGRVFDSQTLEPVNKATVTLLKKRNDGSFTTMTTADLLGGNILNPQTIEEDGGFSFVVPDGTYKLTASHSNYVFPEDINNIQSNYSKIYSDIYPSLTGEVIIQQGAIQHRDIPLKPKTTAMASQAKLMEFFHDLDKPTSTIIVNGKVSHPFAKIKAYSLKPDPISQENVRYRLLPETASADKLGHFVLKVNQSQFEPTETFGEITLVKIDLTQPNLAEKIKQWLLGFISKVNAQARLVASVKFEPILNYLEGYAYDSQGEVIPNSTVSIILNFSNKPSYQAKTDEKGYYKISSEFLPSMPYRITYTTTNGQVIPTSTSKFIVQNNNSIESSDIKINQFKNEKGNIITGVPTPITTANNFQGGTTGIPGAPSSKTKTPTISKMLFLTFTIVVLFIITVVVILLVYIKRKRETV